MRTADFDFDLPDDLIATAPARPRDSARLLDVGPRLVDRRIRDLPEMLAPGDVVVVNDTRVLPARLDGLRGGAPVEVTLHKREAEGVWRAFARPGKRLHNGDVIAFGPHFSAEVVGKAPEGDVVLRFAEDDAGLLRQLEAHGRMPLPPYIKRPGQTGDREDYQTM